MPQTETLEEVQKEGRGRLHPSLTNPNWLVLRMRRQIFLRWLAPVRADDLSVLDVGGRIQPYRAMLPASAHYLAIDLRRTPLVNVEASAEHLPFAGEQFDVIFCTQMLEYVPDPAQVIQEMHRVLKPGGILLLSVPSMALRDSDEDRWRFWPAGIRQLLAPFSQVEVVPEGGSIAGFFRTMSAGLGVLARFQILRTLVYFTAVPVLNLTGLALETLARSRSDVFTVNYSALAKK